MRVKALAAPIALALALATTLSASAGTVRTDPCDFVSNGDHPSNMLITGDRLFPPSAQACRDYAKDPSLHEADGVYAGFDDMNTMCTLRRQDGNLYATVSWARYGYPIDLVSQQQALDRCHEGVANGFIVGAGNA